MLGPPPDPPGPHLSMWQHGVCAWHRELCAGCPLGCVVLRERPVRPTRDADGAWCRGARSVGATASADCARRRRSAVSVRRDWKTELLQRKARRHSTFDISSSFVARRSRLCGPRLSRSGLDSRLSAAAAHLQSLLGSRHSSNVRGFNVSQPHSSYDGAQCRTAQLRCARRVHSSTLGGHVCQWLDKSKRCTVSCI